MRKALALALVALLAGCAQPGGDEAPPGPGVPAAPPFAIGPPERLSFTMQDGVVLDAVAWRPEATQRTPVLLHATPYHALCAAAPDAPYPKPCAPEAADAYWLDEYNGLPRALVEAGYAWLELSVRGTGASGGCFVYLGERERRDLGEVLDQLAGIPWAGEVGMAGLSYMSVTPLEAMEERPGRLKAIVIGGVGFDEYTFSYTPQGADSVYAQVAWAGWHGSVQTPRAASLAALSRGGERACPEAVEETASIPLALALDERPREHFLARRYLDKLQALPTGVLVLQGVLDRSGGQQVEVVWPALEGTPRAMVLGQWEHRFPDAALLDGSGLSWPALPIAWFDHFLRGGPAPDVLGGVRVGVAGGGWETHAEWPPEGAEALALDGLAFRLAQGATACGPDPATWAAVVSEPAPRDVALVGNPMAWLELTSTSPSATIAIDLWDVPGDDPCEGRRLVSFGAADLRYRDDPFRGQDLPLGQTLGTRVDMHAAAWLLPAGHRLAVTLSTSGERGAVGRAGVGALSLGEGSHLLLPTGDGLGEPAPAREYPPRPFAHDWKG